MYKLNYYGRSIADNADKEQKFEYFGMGEFFRLRRNALHYLREIVQNDYREEGYATSLLAGGLYCIKSEKTDKGERKTTEIRIKVEKVKYKNRRRGLTFAPKLLSIASWAIIRILTIRIKPRLATRRWCRFTTSRRIFA